jgi:hypothetical protein
MGYEGIPMPRSYVLAAAAALFLSGAAPGSALTFNWSFDATGGTSTGIVTGTISGLVEGSNDGTGLTVTVLSSPSGNVLGGGWDFIGSSLGGDAFTVTGGAVTFADAAFYRDSGDDVVFFGDYGGYFPELFSTNEFDLGFDHTDHFTIGVQTQFSLAETAVPLPAALPMFASGLGVLGLLAWRRRSKPAAAPAA